MRLRRDGSVQPGATPTPDNVGSAPDYALYRCMITKVTYVDDQANISSNSTNARVLYDVVVLGGGFSAGQVISNCRLASDLGGNSSFNERVLRASSKNVSETKLSDCDGDIVYVQFIQGHRGFPVIIALDNGINTSKSIGASKSQGPRKLRQYNGVREEINKDGEWILSRRGGSSDSVNGSFEPGSQDLVSLKLDKNEKFTVVASGGVTIELDNKTSKISIKKGSTIIELDGNGDKISLKGGFVDLGSAVSDFAVLFTELASAFNDHKHVFPYSAGPTPSVGTTQPPTAPLLSSVGSTTVKVQP